MPKKRKNKKDNDFLDCQPYIIGFVIFLYFTGYFK